MALLYGIAAEQPSIDEADAHRLSYAVARAGANALIFDVWNGPTNASRKISVDKDGKFYSAALTAGDVLYAVTGGVASVRRLDSLAIGAANTVLTSSGTAPQWSTSLSLAGTLTAAGLVTANAGLTVASGQTLTLTGATVAGTPTWSSSQAITLSTAAQPNVTSLGSLTALTIAGNLTFTGASRNIIAGTTNLSIRNTANTADNILVADAGAITLRSTVSGLTAIIFPGTVASAGLIRLANNDQIAWRNSTNSADLPLTVDALNALRYNGPIVSGATGGFQVDGVAVVGARGAAVADATDAASVILRLNEWLARARTHGLIAT